MSQPIYVQPHWVAIVLAVLACAQILGVAYFNYRTQVFVQQEVRRVGDKTEEFVEQKLDTNAKVVRKRLEVDAEQSQKSLDRLEKGLTDQVMRMKEKLSLRQ